MAELKKLKSVKDLDIAALGANTSRTYSTSEVIDFVTDKEGFVPKQDRILALFGETYVKELTWYGRKVTLKDKTETMVFNLSSSDMDEIQKFMEDL